MTRILHLSDPHFGAADTAIAGAFLSQAKETLAPDFTVLSGDLTMRAHHDELAAAKKFVDALPTPRLLIPGNHDIPAINHPFDRFFNPFRLYRKWFGDDLTPESIHGNLHLVSTNSTRAFGFHADWSEGILSKKQLAEIERRFKRGPSELFRVLVLHHPLLAPVGRARSLVKPLPDLLRTIAEARIDLVLCGHFHRSQLATAGPVDGWKCVVSQAPTVCSTRLQGEPQGFHQIQVSKDRIKILPYRFDQGTFTAQPSSGFIRGSDGWMDDSTTNTEDIVANV